MKQRIALSLLLLAGCSEDTLGSIEGQNHALPEGEFGDGQVVLLKGTVEKQVDVLFVVENSTGLGREQGVLARSMSTLVDELSDGMTGADYRIAITTTDDGNPLCGSTTPEAGDFVYSSCLDRESSFTDQTGTQNDFARACSDHCLLDSEDLGIGPGSTPWLEADASGKSNLPAGVSVADALACLVPQGVDGCGFESPLGAMRKSLIRMSTQSEGAYGFHREGAALVVVFVGEEFDCSFNPDYAEAFEASGGKVFWTDPGSNFPTSGMCWNAGVQCEGEPENLDCFPASYAPDGTLLADDDPGLEYQAVMPPVSTYIERLISEDRAPEYGLGERIHVLAITGVPEDGVPRYSSVADADLLTDFGTAPGCVAPNHVTDTPCTGDDDCPQWGATCGQTGMCELPEHAFPPVRIAAVSEAFGEGQRLFSACAEDYDPAMAKIATAVLSTELRTCYPGELYDSDPNTEALEPECLVSKAHNTAWGPHGESWSDAAGPADECVRAADGSYEWTAENGYVIPDDAHGICYALLTDANGSTPGESDDLPTECGTQLAMRVQVDYSSAPPELRSVHILCREQ